MERIVTAERPTAVIVETTTWEAFPALWGGMLAEVRTVASGGINVMLYRDDTPTVEVGILASGFTPAGRVVASALPGGPVARHVHRGPYSGLGDAHAALLRWCAQQGHELTGVRWEVYGHPENPETEICRQLRVR